MHKLAIAAAATATLAAGGIVIATTARSGDAQASAGEQHATAEARRSTTATTAAAQPAGAVGCGHHAARVQPSLPALLAPHRARTAAAFPANDCATVGQHLADLEGATGQEPGDRCASDYASLCVAATWTLEHRLCVLAADDLLNAHLCAFDQTTPPKDEAIPPALACTTIATHIAPIVQNAGLYADVPDFAQQVETACDTGTWSVALRQCFASAQAIDDLHACMQPAT